MGLDLSKPQEPLHVQVVKLEFFQYRGRCHVSNERHIKHLQTCKMSRFGGVMTTTLVTRSEPQAVSNSSEADSTPVCI